MTPIGWLVRGSLDQPTGGYLYDAIVVAGLRAAGRDVRVLSTTAGDASEVVVEVAAARGLTDAGAWIVVDGLCLEECRGLLERSAAGVGPRTALLMHHPGSWEQERTAADRRRLARLEGAAVTAATAVVSTSAATAARLERETAVGATVIAPGCDRLAPGAPILSAGDRTPTFVVVGSVTRRKRHDRVLDAWERAWERAPAAMAGHRLVFLGDPEREPDHGRRVVARARRLPAVDVTGVVTDAVLSATVRSARALVLASSLEGFGMVMAEALAVGTPVLASKEAARPFLSSTASFGVGAPALRTFTTVDDLAARMVDVARGDDEPALEAARDIAPRLPRWDLAIQRFAGLLTP